MSELRGRRHFGFKRDSSYRTPDGTRPPPCPTPFRAGDRVELIPETLSDADRKGLGDLVGAELTVTGCTQGRAMVRFEKLSGWVDVDKVRRVT